MSMTGRQLQAWEVQIIRQMDVVFLIAEQKSAKIKSKAASR